MGVKRPERNADYTPGSDGKVRNTWHFTPSPTRIQLLSGARNGQSKRLRWAGYVESMHTRKERCWKIYPLHYPRRLLSSSKNAYLYATVTEAGHWPHLEPYESTPPTSSFRLTLSFHLRAGLPNGFIPSRFPDLSSVSN